MPAGRRPERRDVPGELAVVPLGRVGGVTVGGVVDACDRNAAERRIPDQVGARAAVVLEREPALRELPFDQRGPYHAPVVEERVPVGILSVDLAVRIDDRRLEPGVVRPLPRVVQVSSLNRLVLRHGAGQLDLGALVVVVGRQDDAGLRQRHGAVDRRVAPRREEPQRVPDDGTAERSFERVLQRVGMGLVGGAALDFERRRGRPRRILEVDPAGAGKGVAPALRHRVDHAAAEPSVLGGDSRRQHLRFLNRVLDEQVLRLRELVVVDIDAVDHEHVVERKRAVDDDLVGIGRILAHGRGQLRDALQGAWRRQLLDFLIREVGADDRRRDRRRCLDHHANRLSHSRRLHAHVLLDDEAQLHGRLLRDRREAAQLEREFVVARRKIDERVTAGGVGGRAALTL